MDYYSSGGDYYNQQVDPYKVQQSPYQTTIQQPYTAPTGPAPGATLTTKPTTAPTATTQPFTQQTWFSMFPQGSQFSSQDLLAKQGALSQYGVKVLTNGSGESGKIQLPDGSIVDVAQGISDDGRGTSQWLTGSGGSGGGSAGGPVMNWNQYNQPTAHAGILDSIWNQINAQAKQGTNIDTNDPTFRKQADTYAAAMERSRRNAVADNAERDNAKLLGDSGAHTAEDRLVNERAGQATAGFEADLAARELQNRRSEIQNALQMAMSAGNAEQQRALTRELGMLDMQLRDRTASNALGFDYSNMESQQNRAALMAMLGGGF